MDFNGMNDFGSISSKATNPMPSMKAGSSADDNPFAEIETGSKPMMMAPSPSSDIYSYFESEEGGVDAPKAA